MPMVHRIVTSVSFACVLSACASEPPRAPHPMQPIPEPRAAELIARTFRDAGVQAEADRYVKLGSKAKKLRLEVAAAGHKYGVAYLTTADWASFGDALPQRAEDDSLVVGIGEGGTRILCLHADDYAEDDGAGDEHTVSTTVADRRLARDVRDFLHRAQQQGWP